MWWLLISNIAKVDCLTTLQRWSVGYYGNDLAESKLAHFVKIERSWSVHSDSHAFILQTVNVLFTIAA